MKQIIGSGIFMILITILLGSCTSQKAANNNTKNINEMIENRRFTFMAQTVIPTEDSRFSPRLMFPNGNNLYQLSWGYDLMVRPDSVTAYLPFYGRSFTAPLDPSKGGIKFTSTNFSYTQSIKKKNYQITIVPNDVTDVRKLLITITPSGYAFVQVLSMNRTPISFNGIIDEKKP